MLRFLIFFTLLCLVLSQVNTEICPDKGKGSSALEGLPRVDRQLKAVSSNLGDYDIYTCKPDPLRPGKQKCQFVSMSGADFLNGSGELSPYIESLVTYFGFAITLGILTGTLGVCIGFWRYCCFCIPGGCCGKRYPTKKSRFCCFPGFLGYVEQPKPDGRSTYAYPMPWRWANRAYMWVFVFFILLWIGMGHFQGNHALTDSMVSVALAPDTLVSTALGATDVLAEFAEAVVGTHFHNLLTGLNSTVNQYVDVSQVLDDLNCTINFIIDFPNIQEIREFINSEIDSLLNTTSILDSVNAAFNDLEAQKNTTEGTVDKLTSYLDDVEIRLNATKANITQVLLDAEEIKFVENSLLNPNYGVETTIVSLEQFTTNKPDSTYVQDTCTILQAVTLGTTTGTINFADLLIRLRSLNNSYSRLPDTYKLADNLEILNSNFTYAKNTNLFSSTVQKINDTQNELNQLLGVSLTTNITRGIDDIIASVQNISFRSFYDLVNQTEAQIRNATNSTEFRARINTFLDIDSVIGCVNNMINQVLNINSTLVTFPDSVNNITNQIKDFNRTFNDANAKIDAYLANLTNFLNDGGAFNFSDLRRQISQLEIQLKNSTNSINTSDIVQQINRAVESANISTNVNQLNSDLQAFNNSLKVTDNSTINNLRSVGDQVPLLLVDLRKQIRDLSQYAETGFCSSDGTTCISTCVSGVCTTNSVNPRCRIDGLQSCSDKTDTSCGASDECLVDKDEINTLILKMLLLDQITPNVTNTLTSLRQVNSTARTDIDNYKAEVNTTLATIESTSLGPFRAYMDDATNAFTGFNLSSYKATFNDLVGQIDGLNLTQIDSLLDQLNSTMSVINNTKQEVVRVQRLVSALRDVLYTKLPDYLSRTTTAKLEEYRQQDGLGKTIEVFADIANDLVQYLNNSQDFYQFTCCNFTNKLDKVKHTVDVIYSPRYRQYGPWHFILSLADSFTNKTTVFQPYAGATLKRVFCPRDECNTTDFKKGQYLGNTICVTNDCIRNEIVYWNTQKISKIADDLGVTTPVRVEASRTEIVSAPYFIPFFIALFGLISSVLLFEGNMSDFFSSCCASLSACMMFCCMPLIFIFAGSFFIFVLVGGDGCKSMENIGYNILSAHGDTLCADQFGGSGPPTNCNITLQNSTSGPQLQFSFDIFAAYSAVLGECNPNADPLQPIFRSLSDSLVNYIPSEFESQLNSAENASDVKLLALKTNFLNFSEALGDQTGVLVQDIGRRVLGCQPLHAVYARAKGAFCCDVLSAVYWMVASWYLIGWSMLCCGCGAAMLGRKRFPHKLWGNAYNADMRASNMKAAEEGEHNWDEGDHGVELAHSGLPEPQFDPNMHGGMHDDGPMGFASMQHDQPAHDFHFNKTPEVVDKNGLPPLPGAGLPPLPGMSSGPAAGLPPLPGWHAQVPALDDEPEFIIERVPQHDQDAPPFDLGGENLGEQGHIDFNGPVPQPLNVPDLQDTNGEIEI